MFDLKILVSFLRLVSMLGLVITIVMMTAVTYHKLTAYYPKEVKAHKVLFIIAAILVSLAATVLFQRFFGHL